MTKGDISRRVFLVAFAPVMLSIAIVWGLVTSVRDLIEEYVQMW